jgi:hypothetical protein
MSDGFGRNYFWRENREWKDLRTECWLGKRVRVGYCRYLRRKSQHLASRRGGERGSNVPRPQSVGIAFCVGRVHKLSLRFCLERVRDGAFRRSFGDEWKVASERISIQPRAPLQAWEELSRGGAGIQLKSTTESANINYRKR